MGHTTPVTGKVYFVGAGPGDPGLITLRGVQCLRQADVVLYDYLVNPRILEHASPTAEQICLGRHGRTRIWPQSEINQRLIESALEGKHVVRLKGGDPAVFARGAEEVGAVAERNIPFEIVPGITAALAAGSHAGIPLTHSRLASAVALVTGHESASKTESSLDFAALARFPGTLVLYMGVTTVNSWTSQLIAEGMPAATPAAIVRKCSLPDQRVIRCQLGEVAEQLTPSHRLRPPVIVIVGSVAGVDQSLCWFDKRPLFGTRVLVTRAAEQSGELEQLLLERGAEVLCQPAIRIEPAEDLAALDACLDRLHQFHWAVFSSSNGVRHFLDRLQQRGYDMRRLGGVQLAAIGPGTAAALQRYHLRADLQPAAFRAESLAEALQPYAPGGRFLLVRASRGREVLAEMLRAAGGHVEQVVAYRSLDVEQPDPQVLQPLAEGHIDWITVTSSAIARSLHSMLGESLRKANLVSISPITSQTLRELGYKPAAEASPYTMQGVIDAVCKARHDSQSQSPSPAD